jgi:methionyl-tRNA formyltransferase
LDAGYIWASQKFTMSAVSKSYLYRHQVSDTAIKCLLEAVKKLVKIIQLNVISMGYAKGLAQIL